MLPRRVICVWKPTKSPAQTFWRETNPVMCVKPVTRHYRQTDFSKCLVVVDKLRALSTDFIDYELDQWHVST